MALTCCGTSFCSTVAATTGTADATGAAALVPVQETNIARTLMPSPVGPRRRNPLRILNAGSIFLLSPMIATIPVTRFCRLQACGLRSGQHTPQPDIGQSSTYLL